MAAKEKVVVITGCNTGIGKETVRALAQQEANIYMACRDMCKCQQARDDIMADSPAPTGSIFCRECDLADFESIRKFAANFKKEESRLDILINNGGVLWGPRTTTKQGIQMQLGVNHVGHFLLTKLLLDTLKNSAPSRIVVVSSASHTTRKIKFEDLNSEKSYGEMACYDQSKLANVFFAKQLAKNLEGTATTLHVALDPSLANATGKYFSDCKETATGRQGNDMEAAAKLWAATEDLIKK